MKLIDKMNGDFIAAFKNREMDRKNFLSVLKTEVTRENKSPEDAIVIGKLKSMIKKHLESIENFDTPTLTELELSILDEYLPTLMTNDQLTEIVKTFIADNDLSGKQNMGRVMGHLKSTYDGQYDGKSASGIVISSL